MKKLISLTSLLLLSCLAVFAQETKKLKEVQAANLWAPSSIKIDGALKEWGDSFQAYNKATKLYYTLSNDDKNIYLAIKSTDAINNNKIIAGGITLTINTDGKKKEKDAFSLTYPVIQRTTRTMRGPGGGAPGMPGRSMTITMGPGGGPGGPGGQPVDSAMIKAAHERTIAAAKEIKVAGFKDITDSLVSIYNEYGIKAAIGYNALGNFTYEMAIPIKLLNLKSDGQELNYNVKVNGIVIPAAMMQAMSEGGNGGGGSDGGQRIVTFGGPGGGGGGQRGGGGGNFQEMTSPSDFWGKYTLAKNQ
ncbi:hypothetical protein [Mucilaginibacter sp.]|uniref:hypothetical protein n=1 Tax=Mucilaginibacter sp. TaxID=1882438 RepID=UPI002618E6F5|nr:hypothetical protein [Mucilaginibacter sp.]MDB5031667.1 hypothetical protein [Mucilaginibacter sp.]